MKYPQIPERLGVGILAVMALVVGATVIVAWQVGDPGEAQKTLRDIVLILGGALGGGGAVAAITARQPKGEEENEQ